jgi:hypothetical protein
MRLALTPIILLLCAACAASSTDSPEERGVDRFLTEDLAGSLSPDGRFSFSEQGAQGELSAPEARVLAGAYLRTFAEPLELTWGAILGRVVAATDLRPCERALYARSPYGPLPRELVRPSHSALGSYWLVFLCEASEPRIVVAVSAVATDLKVRDGIIEYPAIRGGEFRTMPLEPGTYEARFSPEAIARRAALLTRRRVAAAPTLEAARIYSGGPLAAMWRLRAERPFRAKGARSQRLAEHEEILIGITGDRDAQFRGDLASEATLLMPTLEQPDGDSIVTFSRAEVLADRESPITLLARRRTDAALVFETAEVADDEGVEQLDTMPASPRSHPFVGH